MKKKVKRNRELAGIKSREVETINTANKGDYIVMNPTGEEYVLILDKFKKNYFLTPLDEKDSNGYQTYRNRPEERDVVKVTKVLIKDLEAEFKSVPSQKEFHSYMGKLSTVKAQKNVKVKARIVDKLEKVITYTQTSSEEGGFKFIASWGEEMLLKNGDIIVVGSESYRIGKEEFKSTYEFLEK